MTRYTVHLYREMRLVFTGIEADTAEAAAAIADRTPTGEADDIEDCEGESSAALVDVVGDEQFEHSKMVEFESQRQRRAVPRLLAALRRCAALLADHDEHSGEEGQAYRAAASAIAEATDTATAVRRFSVLLLYPDYLDDTGYETHYAFVEAANALDAVALARQQAAAAQAVQIDDPTDFLPLLVTEGHHPSEPLFDR